MLPVLLALAQFPPEFERPFRVRDAGGEIEVEPGGAAPCFADVDGDGLADLLVGRSDGRVELRRNVGARGRPRFEKAELVQAGGVDARVPHGDGSEFTPNLGDVTGDGVPDLVSGSWYTDSAFVFAGRGTGTFAAGAKLLPFAKSGTLVDQGSSVALGDFDRDGDLDLVNADHWGETRLFVNHAGPHAFARLEASTPMRAGPKAMALDWECAPCLADWDADGFLDVVAGGWDGNLLLFAGKGTAEFAAPVILIGAPTEPPVLVPDPTGTRWSVFAQRPQVGARPCAADWNSDGILDLVVGDDVYVEGPEPVLTAKRARAKRELEVLLQDLDARSTRAWNEVRAALLAEHGYAEERLWRDEDLRDAFEVTFQRELDLAPLVRALRKARAQVALELAPLLRPKSHRSTVWVYLRRPRAAR
ncbi:MAG: VCBS repeat-containing protein [Planctomycetes bacterium]|nr:VCBS repeat-containing protein [Planctomycetota bacterium]